MLRPAGGTVNPCQPENHPLPPVGTEPLTHKEAAMATKAKATKKANTYTKSKLAAHGKLKAGGAYT